MLSPPKKQRVDAVQQRGAEGKKGSYGANRAQLQSEYRAANLAAHRQDHVLLIKRLVVHGDFNVTLSMNRVQAAFG